MPATAATILLIGILSLVLSDRKTAVSNGSQTSTSHVTGMAAVSPPADRARGNALPVTPAVGVAATLPPGNLTNQAALARSEGLLSEPGPPKLQAIVFIPARPSAIVSGKTVVVGDRVNEFRVTAIRPDSITLVSESETNVLRMK
ncbi:MAG: hypothetical protein P8Z30_19970 [Acidobacteriota bacterium]